MNALQIFHLLFNTTGIWMRQKQILQGQICYYIYHLLFIAIGYYIDVQSIFSVAISNTAEFYLVLSRDFYDIRIFAIAHAIHGVRK